ncbi:Acyltransferase family protein [Stieleria magnilauensis]|uniref:Acyltransferase family protein n=2 Tax=Stieleria magnilauensis TaxID=2527963 RepID=A0ABX5XMN9_9BACT|nr:Acyltransferase family protein [Planctomycetes bacterium TBK1r]
MAGIKQLLSVCLLLLSIIAGFCAFRTAPVSGTPMRQFTIRPNEHLGEFLPKTIIHVAHPGDTRTVRCESTVDNAWVNLDFRLEETTTGRSIPFNANVSYYHGNIGTEAWESGSRVTTQFLEIPEPGEYCVFVKGTTGQGNDPEPMVAQSGMDIDVFIYNGPQQTRAWLLILAGSLVIGTSILLWTLAHRRPQSSRREEQRLNENPTAALATPQHRDDVLPVPTWPAPAPPSRLAMLDGMRGAAALAVVCCHFFVPELSSLATTLNSIFPDPIPTLAQHGDLGVEVFFVLSGFVIAFSIGNRRMSGRYVANFALRRSIRLDPPYLATLALSMLLWAAYLPGGLTECYQQSLGWRGVLANSFYLQNIFGFPSSVGVAWTLCLEIQFYLAYIGLFSLAQFVSGALGSGGQDDRRDFSTSQTALLATFLPLSIASVIWWNCSLADFSFFGTWHRFFVGVMCYWAFSQRITSVGFFVFAVALAALAIHSHDLRGGTAATTAILIYVAGRTGHLSTALSASWLQYLGRISYSLYLVHLLVGVSLVNMLYRSDQSKPMALCLLVIGLVASIAGAELMYRLFELPSVRLSRKMKCRTTETIASPVSF